MGVLAPFLYPQLELCQVQGIEISPKNESNLIVDAHRVVYAWGLNAFGELGLGNISYLSPRMTVSLTLDENVHVGDENIRLQPARVRVLGSLNALSCAAGSRHTIVILADANHDKKH